MESFSRSSLYDAARSNRDGVGESAGTYYLTLCSVTTPVTVPEPKSPTLQRYRFFFTRKHENGRESFWLHFGYFRTAEEAHKWCDVLARVYPAAAIRSLSQNGATQPTHETSQILTQSQVFSLLGRQSEEDAVQPNGSPASRRETSLEDTSSELRDSAWQSFGHEDAASTTGVRHLRVEVQAKSRPRAEQAPKVARKL
jgi:hypothetical protein